MTEDLATLHVFAFIGFIAICAVIVVGALWLVNLMGRWFDR